MYQVVIVSASGLRNQAMFGKQYPLCQMVLYTESSQVCFKSLTETDRKHNGHPVWNHKINEVIFLHGSKVSFTVYHDGMFGTCQVGTVDHVLENEGEFDLLLNRHGKEIVGVLRVQILPTETVFSSMPPAYHL